MSGTSTIPSRRRRGSTLRGGRCDCGRRRPVGYSARTQEIVDDFSIQLHRNKRVSDGTFQRAEQRFGKRGVVDLTGINGYYVFLVMQLNAARYPMPKNGKKLVRMPE